MKSLRKRIASATAMVVGTLFLFGMLHSTQALAEADRDAPPHSQPTALSAAAAMTMTLAPVKDTTIFEGLANSGGASALLFAGFITNDAKERRALLAFDLSQVPTNTQIVSATLVLNVSKSRATADTPFALHRLLNDWGEAGSSGGGGQGAPAKNGDATWEFAFFNTATWTNSGGDFATAASATTSVGGIGAYRWSGPQLLADVQAWLAAPTTNFGWILLGVEDKPQTAKQIIARENSNAATRPQLILTFSESISETQTSTLYLPLVQK